MNIYRAAELSQGACNLGGLVHGWAKAMEAIQAEARQHGHGTDWINRHPVNILFAEQVYHLTGYGGGYSEALAECIAKGAQAAASVPVQGDSAGRAA